MIFENPGGPPRPRRLEIQRRGRKGTRRNLRNAFTAKAQSTARRTWNERFLRLGAPSGLGMPGGTAVAVGGAGANGAWGSVSGRIFRCAVFARRTSSRPATGRDGLRSFDSREKKPLPRQPWKKTSAVGFHAGANGHGCCQNTKQATVGPGGHRGVSSRPL